MFFINKNEKVLAYIHFPIIYKGLGVELKNFLGEKILRTIKYLSGVTIKRNEAKE